MIFHMRSRLLSAEQGEFTTGLEWGLGAACVKNIWLIIWLVLLSRIKIITVYYFVLLRLLLKIITSYFSEIAI